MKKKKFSVWYRILKKIGSSPYSLIIAIFIPGFLFFGLVIFWVEEATNKQFSSILDSLWWAIITFSTTGYGDKIPQTVTGRVVTSLAIIFGLALTSAFSATMATRFIEFNSRSRRGLRMFKRMSNHLIICGWKNHMAELLMGIVEQSQKYLPEDIVIVSNVDPEVFEKIFEYPELVGVKYIRGDYFSEQALHRANIEKAEKVIVLADTLESRVVTEVDSKTVLTVITIKNMVKEVYICAELIDPKYINYLKQVMCEEIVMVRDMSKQLLVSSSAHNGISHIIQELLQVSLHSQEDNVKLATLKIPQRFIGQEYGNYSKFFVENYGHDSQLLGLLENTGNPQKLKILRVREAQKTANVQELVEQLSNIKHMEINKPLLLPSPHHIIREFSLAIVLGRDNW